jgi:Tfp pilus assembly protein PilF
MATVDAIQARSVRRWVALLGAGALLLGAVACARGEAPTGGAAVVYRNHDAGVGYVGMAACKSCHLGIHSTYGHTGMGRAFYPMAEAERVEDFTDDNEFHAEEWGLDYRMETRDGRYFQREFVRDSRGREIVSEERELIFVVGSNNHSRSYITQVGDKLFQAPVCWYPQEEKWELCPGYELMNDHFSREISLSCLHCHNGRMEPIEGERNAFETPYPNGIGCERCHGPGELHVERWSDTSRAPTGAPDSTIVNPRRLSRDARLDVCAQCHLGDSKASERVGRYGRELQDYRPGQRLTEYMMPFHYVEPTHYDFGLSSQVDRLVESACFKQGQIDCLTCHNPHVSTYHEEQSADYFRSRCIGCHELDDCVAPPAAREATEPEDDCVACHMRKGEPDDQRFTEFTDHWIRRDITIDEPDHRERFELQPVYPDAYAALPRGEQAYYRGRAFMLLAGRAPEVVRSSMWVRAAEAFEEAIDNGFDNEASWFFLGKMRATQRKRDEAIVAYRKALEHDAAHHDAAFALAQTLAIMGQLDLAEQGFREMLARAPDNPMALAELGRMLWTRQRYEEALELYGLAVEQEPWTADFHLNLGMSLAAMGRFDEAARAGERATRLDPNNPEMWNLYWNAMREVGRADAAREGQRLHRLFQK